MSASSCYLCVLIGTNPRSSRSYDYGASQNCWDELKVALYISSNLRTPQHVNTHSQQSFECVASFYYPNKYIIQV